MKKRKVVGIKIGSNLLTNGDGLINYSFVADVCRQVSEVKREYDVFLVRSGAVASDGNEDRSPESRAAVGQAKLIATEVYHFGMYGLSVAQLLPTYHDLRKNNTYFFLNYRNILHDRLAIPDINYNDPMDNREMKQVSKYSDNDNLFKRICMVGGVDIPIIGFNSPGITDPSKNVIREIYSRDRKKIMGYIQEGSSSGYGKGKEGPLTKVKVAFDLAKICGKAILVPGYEKDFILRAIAGELNFGTIFYGR
ncbi:MAG: hypothetical protein Q7T50_00720 [Candidatus Magasanikbacteria bacterium]|nr:hypothetical protein [Candidatus Magasanikbacteria bacterium]